MTSKVVDNMKPMNVIEIKIVAKLLMCLPYFNSIQLPPF